jgi:hypothetical protein
MRTEVEVVQNAANMDLYLFVKHFNMRHSESLGLSGAPLPAELSPAVEEAYRAFHRNLHLRRLGLSHTHGDARPE